MNLMDIVCTVKADIMWICRTADGRDVREKITR